MNIKAIIKSRGLTLTEVAARMGISRVTLMQNLQRNPTQKTLQRIANAIGCDIAEFYEDTTNKNRIIGFVELDNVIYKIDSVQALKELAEKAD